MPPSDQLEYQITTIRSLIANTSPQQLEGPTPCSDWAARDLINHMVGGGMVFGAALAGDPAPDGVGWPPPDVLGDDPVAAWDKAIVTFRNGVDSPGALDREITLPFGTMPGSVVVEVVKLDLLLHAWDLAQATGQPFDPPADVVAAAATAAPMIIAPELRDGDTFAAEVSASSGATPMDQLAAFAGRSL